MQVRRYGKKKLPGHSDPMIFETHQKQLAASRRASLIATVPLPILRDRIRARAFKKSAKKLPKVVAKTGPEYGPLFLPFPIRGIKKADRKTGSQSKPGFRIILEVYGTKST